MVAVAHGGCSAVDLQRALAGEDSPAGRQQAPAHGLCLERVAYDPEPAWAGR
jgi:tRNA U38,U39,U40 pseudouridine synthase TruA